MFETVAPEKFAKRSRKAFYEALPLSLAFHALVGGGVLAANIWKITFPDQSPAQMIAFNLADTPPPPPPPPPPPKPQPAQQVTVKRVEVPREIVAPTVIPDVIPEVLPEPVVYAEEGVAEGVEGGIPGGEIGGVVGGVIGSVIIAEQPKPEPIPDRVTIERDKPLPLYPLSQVYPTYPEDARLRAWEDRLVVRYVIGKDGRVKEVTVISSPERELFIQPTVKAIRTWRFRPLIKNGERQEVVHELTVFYKLEQAS